LVLLASLAGCSDDFLDRVRGTSDNLSRFAEESGLVPKSAATLEARYQEGVELRRRGADAEAAARFREAAEDGHAAAAYELAQAYREGRGIEQDDEKAAHWFTTAAERGDPRAQYLLGTAYYSGAGVDQDYEIAAVWLGKAAVQGHVRAQFLLAVAFANGRGVAQNQAWAARWYGKAARQGHREAQFTYGLMLATGRGLPRDPRQAYTWLTIAVAGGYGRAEEPRRSVAGLLTPSDIDDAEAAARRFVPGPATAFADPPTVKYVQHALNAMGFLSGPVDGIFGTRTHAGIRAYQQARGQLPNGQVTHELLVSLLQEPRV
jgi:TPR repeat protein